MSSGDWFASLVRGMSVKHTDGMLTCNRLLHLGTLSEMCRVAQVLIELGVLLRSVLFQLPRSVES